MIRETWGNKTLAPNDFKLIFLVGQSDKSKINELLVEEFQKHNDILQLNNFLDSYDYLTIKVMKGFKWISKYCKNAQYVLRINDDVLVNTFSLMNFFKNVLYKQNQLYGHLLRKSRPVRFRHKHMVSIFQYEKEFYPDYPEGVISIFFFNNEFYHMKAFEFI